MPNPKNLGARAIVLGGGIAGKLAARVLADSFERVTLLERDDFASGDGFRKGVPQARFIHSLLRAGLDACDALLPGFEAELFERGAVPCRPARDFLFFDALGLWPRFDVGPEVPLQTRPLIEQTLERRLAAIPNVELRGSVTVSELIVDGDRVVGVACRDASGKSSRELADLIVDATGRSAHSPEWLRRNGFAAPEETRIEVDITYVGCLARPRHTPSSHGALVAEPPPDGVYGSLINVQEGGVMIVGIGSRGRNAALAEDYAGLVAQAERLPHPAAFEMLRDADPITPLARFGFAASVHRHYERLERVPSGFLCIGDAFCSFNPIWGQGMTVAALEVHALARMLAERAGDRAALADLAKPFYAECARIVATPWSLSVGPDLAFSTTRGERSPESKGGRGFMRALGQLGRQDPAVRGLIMDVFHLVKPREALASPELLARLAPMMTARP